MKERPILFSGPMVRAILSGRKTVTRRVVSPQPSDHTGSGVVAVVRFNLGHSGGMRCPFGEAGDRLWVRETFAESVPGCDPRGDGPAHPMTWRPSIFMRREASRITLDVVSVRAERLHDITDEDIAAEGVDREAVMSTLGPVDREIVSSGGLIRCPRDAWRLGWNAINGKRAPWSANPWVWRVEFRRAA